jgi:hypothetical protein
MQKKINYYTRDFNGIRSELINFTRKHFPTTYTEFDDASIGMLLLELNAAVADMLSFNIDRVAQENLLEHAQEKRSLMALARTYGLKIPFKRPSVTICEFSVEVQALGDSFDLSYAPFLSRGAQVIGGGQKFETLNDIDFSSPFSANGVPNRRITPNIDNTGDIASYTLRKSELVIAGETKFYKRIINSEDSRPFLEIDLPDNDILSVDSVISLDGTDYQRNPTLSEQVNPNNLWYLVESLAESKVFIEQPLLSSDKPGVLVGEWRNITRRFMYDFSDRGYVTVRFGNGVQDTSASSEYVTDSDIFLDQIQNYVLDNSLGDIPKANSTLFIKYRVGGGASSNIGVNTITNLGIFNIFVPGQNPTLNQRVRASLKVNNPLPGFGGSDEPGLEEMRSIIRYNFAAQNRCVTLKDYYSRIYQMNGKFGVPYKAAVAKINNKIEISIVGIDENGKLTNLSTNTMKDNIAVYLEKYKMPNDYVSVKDGKILNIGFEFDLFVDPNFNRNEIASEVINATNAFIQEQKLIMGQDIYLSQLVEIVNNIGGVLNVVTFRVYNKVGQGIYSLNRTGQPLVDTTTGEINLLGQNAIFSEYDEIFEIKYPERDIKVRFSS